MALGVTALFLAAGSRIPPAGSTSAVSGGAAAAAGASSAAGGASAPGSAAGPAGQSPAPSSSAAPRGISEGGAPVPGSAAGPAAGASAAPAGTPAAAGGASAAAGAPSAAIAGSADSEGLYAAAQKASREAASENDSARRKGHAASAAGAVAQKPKPEAPKPGAGAERVRPAVYKPPVGHEPGSPAGQAGRLVFVIDDVGNSMSQLEPFLRLPFPITFAVMPGLPHSREAAERIKAAGKELILHQPMQPIGSQNPGPGAIFLSMSPEEAAQVLEKNLDSLPGVVGFNNHEGSAVTQNEEIMSALLAVAKRKGIYYLDSRTIAETVTHEAAVRVGIRYWERDVFLDNSPDKDSIVEYIDVGKKKAQKSGSSVMIGHVWSANLASTLMELYPQLVEAGFSLTTISEMILEESHADSRN